MADIFFEAEIRDDQVSFNMRRSYFDLRNKFRKIVIQQSQIFTQILATPGIRESRERKLLGDIRSYQNWKDIKKYSWKAEALLFSLLWRFGINDEHADKIKSITLVDAKTIKQIKLVNKKHRQAIIGAGLKAGTIYLLPDREVLFNSADRFKQPYARKVLLAVVDSHHLIFIPMSSKTDRMNEEIDILFDRTRKEALSFAARPAVENFPYTHFKRPVALFVSAAQPMLKEDFIHAALIPLGTVRNEVLDCIKEKMKKK